MSQSIRRALYRVKGLPDPGPTPSVDQTQLTILIPRLVARAIDELHELVAAHYPSRNDFLEDLLKEGLKNALQAKQEAEQALLQASQPQLADIEVGPRPVVVNNPDLSPEENANISARLRALRGEQPS